MSLSRPSSIVLKFSSTPGLQRSLATMNNSGVSTPNPVRHRKTSTSHADAPMLDTCSYC